MGARSAAQLVRDKDRTSAPGFKESKRAYDKAYCATHKKRLASYRKNRRYSLDQLWKRLNKDAHRRGYTVTLTFLEFQEMRTQRCHYCGGELPGQGHGIDRADNTLGYLLSNVVACCTRCNKTKGKWLSHDEMVLVATHRVQLGSA